VLSIKICLYSPIKDTRLFKRVGFYRDDIAALSLHGDEVTPTNSLIKILLQRPNLLVGYFYSKSVLAALLGRIIGARVILTGGADQISPVLSKGFRLAVYKTMAFIGLLLAHRILLSCKDDVSNYCKLTFGLQFLRKKIELVNHVVLPVKKKGRSSKKKEFNAFTLCWMGSINNVKRKGVDKSISLIARLRENSINAYLQIAGTDGPGKSYLEDMCIALGVKEYVFFLGEISEEEKEICFSNNAVYLQLSTHEGFGVAAAEAYFSEMIVVHSNKGGLKDVIGDKGIVFRFEMLDDCNDGSLVREFYSEFLNYEVNKRTLKEDVVKYTIDSRSQAFLGDDYV
jgi:glycosyltransferase involved in cell wall biosynthesis